MLNRRERRNKRTSEKGVRLRSGKKREEIGGWQNRLVTPGERLSSLLLSPRLADLTITFPGTHHHIKAHRLVLAMSSTVFEKIFFGDGGGYNLYATEEWPDTNDDENDDEGSKVTGDRKAKKRGGKVKIKRKDRDGIKKLSFIDQPRTKVNGELEMAEEPKEMMDREDSSSSSNNNYTDTTVNDEINKHKVRTRVDDRDAFLPPHIHHYNHYYFTCTDSPEAFLWLLEHMYKGVTRLPGLPLVLDIAPLALKYQMPALAALCSRHLEESVREDTVLTIYNTATTLQDPRLLARCAQVVREDEGRVLEGREVGQLTRPSLHHLLSHPPTVSQVTLFRCVILWAQAQITSTKDEDILPTRPSSPTPYSALRQDIIEFLPLIHFLDMTASEYVTTVMPSGVFTAEEDLAILMNIQGSAVPLPPTCFASPLPSSKVGERK
ncbi:hypothetical protein Pmani_036551 [Petrolisthes manimaculis]|uniref:BTB domain-containing protein n=1 Tax=Petrolisthes manimaculis TaxID=1843537 RepID=A0AAE1NJ48_9EUCA|nr:hypothetical protein Pmani_036551 [Petrolisthes manimaculis]